MGTMLAIELAVVKGWSSIWLETDSVLLVEAFKKPVLVPRTLRGRPELDWLGFEKIKSLLSEKGKLNHDQHMKWTVSPLRAQKHRGQGDPRIEAILALKANKKSNSEEPEQRQSRTFSPFDNPTNISEKLRKIGIGKARKAKIRKREKPARELELTREGVGVREWKKGRKVQIQAVGEEEEDLVCGDKCVLGFAEPLCCGFENLACWHRARTFTGVKSLSSFVKHSEEVFILCEDSEEVFIPCGLQGNLSFPAFLTSDSHSKPFELNSNRDKFEERRKSGGSSTEMGESGFGHVLAAAVIAFSSDMSVLADLNKFEAKLKGEFGIG
ncbi:hypothetical protein V8G54_010512 [Vigna mungo]|uniref:RNase H type-1 domain-containing protein n=1 Tax=Vigna mungo TaxID=3915 RepID=A0AAQ3NY56_VIGMU